MSQRESESDVDGDFIPLNKRVGWADVDPIYPSEAESSVVKINYTDKFAQVFAYFRALLQSGEKSERALQLTAEAAELNPANYTVWQYRRALLKHLNSDLNEELSFISEIIDENPKNYQVWHHRRLLVEMLNSYSDELSFVESILEQDAKNYHAWQHRIWVVRHFSLLENPELSSLELSFASRLLSEDLRNNSAWNYRYFLVSNTPHSDIQAESDVFEREKRITLEAIRKAPHNESSWNYLSGILLEKGGVSSDPDVWKFCCDLYEKSPTPVTTPTAKTPEGQAAKTPSSGQDSSALSAVGCRSPHLLSFMVEVLKERAEKTGEEDGAGAAVLREEAVKLVNELMEVDPIRTNYWQYIKSGLLVE